MMLADAANVTAIRNGRGLAPSVSAVAIAIGARDAAVELFDIVSVRSDVKR